MWLKIIILILLAAVLISLFSGALFLSRGQEDDSRRLLSALTLRISLSVVIVLLIAWGFWSGQLRWGVPWLH